MNHFLAALQVELLKARKSKMIWITAGAFTIAPLVGAFFMFVLKDPELAQRAGLLGAKAQIAGEAAWPAYLSLLAQMIAIGGVFIFGFVTSWLFGREYADRTMKDLLALPNRRAATAGAKFITAFLVNGLLSFYVTVLGILLGFAVGLPGWSGEVFRHGTAVIAVSAALTISASTPVAFIACLGKGYLAPLGFVVLTVMLSQIIAAVGYGDYFPWSVPALFSGVTGTEAALSPISLTVVAGTCLAGLFGTLAWWRYADQA